MSIGLLPEELQKPDDPKKFYGVVTGQVIPDVDITGQGRVKVRLPFIDSLDTSAWARVALPIAGALHGMYFIPNPGDTVLVAFEHGDVDSPFILGSLWNLSSPPPLPAPTPQVRAIRTPAGNQVIFSETPPTITIQTTGPVPPVPGTPSGLSNVVLTSAGVTLQAGPSTISVTPAGITISAAGSQISLTARGLELRSVADVQIDSLKDVDIHGVQHIKLNTPA